MTIVPSKFHGLELWQINALVAQYVFGWRWLCVNFYDIPTIENQLWLLPDIQAVHNLRPGEWVWFCEDRREGPLNNRILPTNMLLDCSSTMDHAWTIVEKLQKCDDNDRIELFIQRLQELSFSGRGIKGDWFLGVNELRICEAALYAYGVIDRQGVLLESARILFE